MADVNVGQGQEVSHMSVFVASHSLHSIVVDAPAFTVTQNSALDSGSGTFAVSSARLSTSTVMEESIRFAGVV